MSQTKKSITRFQNTNASTQPAIDPVSGRQSSLTSSEPPLRICLLSGTYPPDHFDGIGRHTNLMARGLFELGHTVHVITRGEREQVAFYDGAYVHKIVLQTNRYGRYRRLPNLFHVLNYSHTIHDKIEKLVLNEGIQIVDSPIWQFEGLVTAISKILPVVLRLATSRQRIASIQNDRNDDTRLMIEMERAIVAQADHLIPNTQATLDTIKEKYSEQLPLDRYTIIPHGIMPEAEENTRPFDPKHPPSTFTVLYVGRLEKRKGIQDLFKAIPTVIQQKPNVRFVIAGPDNSQHDGFQSQTGMDYPSFFARHHRDSVHNVTFKGFVSDEDLKTLYQTCDLFVAPSLYESFGLIYLEAMNYAKPVIGCCAGGVPEVVDHNVTGVLVEPGNPRDLASAIIELLNSSDRLYEMGMAGRERLMRKFTYIQMAQNFARLYRKVIQRFSSKG
jgi:glycogen(starch) synthase